MTTSWDQKRIQQYIDDKIQESLTLDYKAAEALQKKDEKRKEITKDVSAMANSAGGIIIYGVREYKSEDSSFFPEIIDPVDQSLYTKELLQQVINTIRPKLDGVIITPVQIGIDTKTIVYIVEIQQSTTAHQASDYRYYKRYNSLSIPMEDYEIRDVMGRLKNPEFEVTFRISKNEYDQVYGGNPYGLNMLNTPKKTKHIIEYSLEINAKNISSVVTNYIIAFFKMPSILISEDDKIYEGIKEESDIKTITYERSNTVRDIVDTKFMGIEGGCINKYGPSRYDPILPKLGINWSIDLDKKYEDLIKQDLVLKWEIYADNANPAIGEIKFNEMVIETKTIEHE